MTTIITTTIVIEGPNGEVPFDITTAKNMSDLANVQVQVSLDNGASVFNIPATYTPAQFANTLNSSIVGYQTRQNAAPQIALLTLLASNPLNLLSANGFDVSSLQFAAAVIPS